MSCWYVWGGDLLGAIGMVSADMVALLKSVIAADLGL